MAFLDYGPIKSQISGVRLHKPSDRFIAEIGYHKISQVSPDGTVSTKRIRATHYLGDRYDLANAEAKYAAIKHDWESLCIEQQAAYDAESEQRRLQGLPPLPRFKPVWPKTTVKSLNSSRSATMPARSFVEPAITLPAAGNAFCDLTIRAARDRYESILRKRIGLQNGKGINQNTFEKSLQSLDLGLRSMTTKRSFSSGVIRRRLNRLERR